MKRTAKLRLYVLLGFVKEKLPTDSKYATYGLGQHASMSSLDAQVDERFKNVANEKVPWRARRRQWSR